MSLAEDVAVTAADWVKGIALSVTASIVGGASKLAIRKSWLLEREAEERMRVSQHSTSVASRGGEQHVTLCCDGDGDTSHVHALLPCGSRSREHLPTDETEPMETFEDDPLDADDITENNSVVSTIYDPETRLPRCSPSSWLAWILRASGMFGMSVLNPLCCVFAMNYASPSILAPFSGLTLVWIVLLSSPLIGEQPAPRQVVAATLIVLGEVVVAIFGDHTNDEGRTVADVVSLDAREEDEMAFKLLDRKLTALPSLSLRSASPTRNGSSFVTLDV